MMAHSRAWLFCSLFLLSFGWSLAQLVRPIIRVTGKLHSGLTYNFTCDTSHLDDSDDVTRTRWWLDGLEISDGTNNFVELELNSTLHGSRLRCVYHVTSSTSSSPFSTTYVINILPLPAPVYSPTNRSQAIIDSLPYKLECNAPNYLIPHIERYTFWDTSIGAGTTEEDILSTAYKTVFPNQFFLKSFTCAYFIGETISPRSNIISMIATSIASVLAMPSDSEVYLGENITFSCHITKDPATTPPPSGDFFSYKWFDEMDNLVPNSNVTSIQAEIMTPSSTYRCEAAANNDVYIASLPANITVLAVPVPVIIEPETQFFFSGASYTFECGSNSLVEDVSISWLVDSVTTLTPVEHQLTLTMEDDPVVIECVNDFGNGITATSSPSEVTTTVLPPPIIKAGDDTQEMIHEHPFELRCISPIAFADVVQGFYFMAVADDGSFDNFTSDNHRLDVRPSQFQRFNFTCSYDIDGFSSPSSDSFSLWGTIITRVITTSTEIEAFYGQIVTLVCVVETILGATPAPGGDAYTYQWFDDDGNFEGMTQESTLKVTMESEVLIYICHAAANNERFIPGEPVNIAGMDLPSPFVVKPSLSTLFEGNSYTVMCNSSAQELVSFSEYKWWMNGLPVDATKTKEQNFIIPSPTSTITCVTSFGIFDSPRSDSITLTVTTLPAPQVNDTNPWRIFFSGSTYTFTCASEFAADATSYSFIFKDNASLSTTQEEASIAVMAEVSNPHKITCIIHNFNSSSPESPPLLMNVVEIPKPNVKSPDIMYFSGNTYVFRCRAPEIRDVSYTGYLWTFNESRTILHGSNQINFDTPEPPYAVRVTCNSLIDQHKSVVSDPLHVAASVISQPTIQVSPDQGLFINGTTYNLTCISDFSKFATEYSFNFANDINLNKNQADPTITVIADVSQAHDIITCIVSNYNSSSVPSKSIDMTATVPSPPTIQLLDASPHYLVGSQYALECQSDLDAFVTKYCLKNFTTHVTCQTHLKFMFTAEETEQLLMCNIYFGDVFTDYSQGVSITGSGIVNTSASASTLIPYPGTNVTLTCNAAMTTGYDESDVTFWWREESTVIAHTKVASVYVMTNMVTSFQCEGTTGMVNVSSNVLNITAKDLPTPNIEVQNRPANDSYEPGHHYNLICNSELEDLLTSYNWYNDGQLVKDAHIKQYLAQAMSYTHLYSCSFMVVSEESPGSPSLTIATESIESVHVESNGMRSTTLTPVFDSSVTLICVAAIKPSATESPTYIWLENGIQVQVGTDQELTIVAYAGYNNPIVCEVTVGEDVMASNQVTITSREDLPSPEISLTTHQVSQILPHASYTLRCISDSLSLNSTVTWYKDLNRLSCLRDRTLDITRYDPSVHNGQYTCEIAVFGMAARSGPTVMLGIAPGKECQVSAQCRDLVEGFTGECQDQRCVCSEGHTARLDACVLA